MGWGAPSLDGGSVLGEKLLYLFPLHLRHVVVSGMGKLGADLQMCVCEFVCVVYEHGAPPSQVGSRVYRLKKRACNCTPSKIQTEPKNSNSVYSEGKPANVTKYSINYNRI